MGQIIEVPGHGKVEFPDGMSDAQIVAAIQANPPPSAPTAASAQGGNTTLGDISNAINTGVNWAGTQFTKAGTGILGASKGVGETNQAIAEWLGQKLGAPETGQAVGSVLKHVTPIPGSSLGPSTADLNRIIFSKEGFGVPEVNAGDNPALTLRPPLLGGGSINVGKALDVGAQAIPGMLMGPAAVGGPIRQGITTAVPAFTSGVGSELAGQAAEGADLGPIGNLVARLIGGAGGYMAGNRGISPLPTNLTPEAARNVQTARGLGVPMTVSQETGRLGNLESAVSRMPGGQGPFETLRDQQATGAQRAALDTIGAVGERTDPATMARVYGEKSAQFNAIKNASGPVVLDVPFYQKLQDIVAKHVEGPASDRAPAVTNRAQEFIDLAKQQASGPRLNEFATSEGATLTGPQYQAFRKSINDAAQSTGNMGVKNALKDMRTALDDAMARSLPPEQAQAWQQARADWSGLKTLLKAAAGGSVGGRAEGNLSPNALTAALKQSQGPDRFATATGGLNDIARMSGYLADTVPNSGTPQTLNMQQVIRALMSPAGAGGAVGTAIAGPVIGGPIGVAGGVAGTNALARALTGGRGAGLIRDYLVNQAAQINQNPLMVGARNAIIGR